PASPAPAAVGLAIQIAQLARRCPPDGLLQPGQSAVGVQFGPGLKSPRTLTVGELRQVAVPEFGGEKKSDRRFHLLSDGTGAFLTPLKESPPQALVRGHPL